MSVIIDGHIYLSIGIACHEIKATCALKCILLFFGSLPVVFNHGQPWSLTMVDHGRPWSTMILDHGRPRLAMVCIRPWSTIGGHLTNHGRPWSTMVDHDCMTMVDHGMPWSSDHHFHRDRSAYSTYFSGIRRPSVVNISDDFSSESMRPILFIFHI